MSDDYISREAVLELLCRECIENCTGGTPYQCYVPCAEWKLIQALPDADVKPVVRGEWKLLDKIFYCSKCEKCYPYRTAFRPNCGADMEENNADDGLSVLRQ